ncbi:MAG TPA: hypothetical protein VFW90_02555 [Candidatus Saccharimonadales bacterium]|nr:hypothetical protein [Candidatus Saccharimonadales bacterium]
MAQTTSQPAAMVDNAETKNQSDWWLYAVPLAVILALVALVIKI